MIGDIFGNALGNSIIDSMRPRLAAAADVEIGASEEMGMRTMQRATEDWFATGTAPPVSNPSESTDNPTAIRSGSNTAPDDASAAAATAAMSEVIEAVVSTAPRWRIGEEWHHWNQLFTYANAFHEMLDEDYAAARAAHRSD